FPQRAEAGPHLVKLGKGLSATLVVEGKGDVTEFGESLRPTLLLVVEAQTFVRDQYGGPPALAGGKREAPHHRQPSSGIFDVSERHHRCGSSSRRLSHR